MTNAIKLAVGIGSAVLTLGGTATAVILNKKKKSEELEETNKRSMNERKVKISKSRADNTKTKKMKEFVHIEY